jgi:ATP-dependent HslUV protease ATP-binding subunit HslU
MEDMGVQFKDMLGKMFPPRKKSRNMRVREASRSFCRRRASALWTWTSHRGGQEGEDQTGIIFIDEIDKSAAAARVRARTCPGGCSGTFCRWTRAAR